VHLVPDDIIVNADEHQAVLDQALSEATSNLVVCSAFLSRPVLEGVATQVAAALSRGVSVDLLWGYAGHTPDVASALDFIKKLQYDNKHAPGSLTCNREPSGSHAKLIIWNTTEGVNACVGSYNWLSAGSTPMGELSIHIRHPSLVADLARFVADRWSEIPGARLDVAQRRWHQLAASWERQWVEESDAEAGVVVSLVFGRGHEAALRRALVDTSPGVLAIMSHRAATVGVRRLEDGRSVERANFTGVLTLGEFLDVAPDEVGQMATNLGMRFLHRPVHAKVLIHGNVVLVGSYNYLSADPPSRGGRARELSVRLDGEGSRKLIQARLPEVWRPGANASPSPP
jgi:hypothetical protein